jgi:hypothetical protein
MLPDVRLGRDQGQRVIKPEQESRGRQVDDASKAADEMSVSRPQLVEGEIGEAGIALGRGMARQKTPRRGGARAWPHLSHQRQTPTREGVAEAVRGVEEKAGAGVLLEIARVPSQARKQEDGGSVGLGCGQDQRSVRMPRFMVQGGEGALKGRAHDLARGNRRLRLGVGGCGRGDLGGHARAMKIVWVAVSRHNMVGSWGTCHN